MSGKNSSWQGLFVKLHHENLAAGNGFSIKFFELCEEENGTTFILFSTGFYIRETKLGENWKKMFVYSSLKYINSRFLFSKLPTLMQRSIVLQKTKKFSKKLFFTSKFTRGQICDVQQDEKDAKCGNVEIEDRFPTTFWGQFTL